MKMKVVGGHGIAVRDTKRGRINREVTSKEFGEGDKEGKESIMWKNREKDWYNAERRFIFAT